MMKFFCIVMLGWLPPVLLANAAVQFFHTNWENTYLLAISVYAAFLGLAVFWIIRRSDYI